MLSRREQQGFVVFAPAMVHAFAALPAPTLWQNLQHLCRDLSAVKNFNTHNLLIDNIHCGEAFLGI